MNKNELLSSVHVAMWRKYNAMWDKFMRDYVFSAEPPFIIKPRKP